MAWARAAGQSCRSWPPDPWTRCARWWVRRLQATFAKQLADSVQHAAALAAATQLAGSTVVRAIAYILPRFHCLQVAADPDEGIEEVVAMDTAGPAVLALVRFSSVFCSASSQLACWHLMWGPLCERGGILITLNAKRTCSAGAGGCVLRRGGRGACQERSGGGGGGAAAWGPLRPAVIRLAGKPGGAGLCSWLGSAGLVVKSSSKQRSIVHLLVASWAKQPTVQPMPSALQVGLHQPGDGAGLVSHVTLEGAEGATANLHVRCRLCPTIALCTRIVCLEAACLATLQRHACHQPTPAA